MSELNYVYAAFGIAWVTLLGYGIYLLRRRARAERALVEVSTMKRGS
jgi:CcmD family protein